MKATGSVTAAGITDNWLYSLVRVTAIRAVLWFDSLRSKLIEGILQVSIYISAMKTCLTPHTIPRTRLLSIHPLYSLGRTMLRNLWSPVP